MKKKYSEPKLTAIGDMVNNTLGSSGNRSDNGTQRSGGYSSQNNSTQDDGFNNNSFNNNGF